MSPTNLPARDYHAQRHLRRPHTQPVPAENLAGDFDAADHVELFEVQRQLDTNPLGHFHRLKAK